MAVAGSTAPAQHIARVDGRYYVIHAENRPTDVLQSVELAKTALLSGQSVWIRADDRVKLAAELRTDIRSIRLKGA